MAVDVLDTELERKAREQQTVITLYDPPLDGATPLDGEGNPRTSVCRLSQKAEKLAQGFTEAPVLAPEAPATSSDAEAVVEEEKPRRRR